MTPLLVIATASFACLNPAHHDGDNIRCAGIDGEMRLHGIDAPEMPGACRPGRTCTPGDPYAARDHLATLTRGRKLICAQVDTDVYGRRVVDCRADGVNIACEMIADGYAVERYGSPDCGTDANAPAAVSDWPGGEPPRPGRIDRPEPPRVKRQLPPPRLAEERWRLPADPGPQAIVEQGIAMRFVSGIGLGWLGLINVIGYAAMASDKRRALATIRRRTRRVPESTLLLIAMLGGSIGIFAAQRLLRHKTLKQPFSRNLLLIAGLQIGIGIGMMLAIGWNP